MKVLICNERLLFRFGLDRVLILLAKGLKERGHEIYLMSAQWDEAVISPLTDRFIPVPGPADYAKFNEHVADWLRSEWDCLFTPYDRPDVVLVGGWPFFAAIGVFGEICPAVVFVEPGAVPLDGFDEGGLAIQKILRDHRKMGLPQATAAFPISQFLAETQTIVDGVAADRVQTILLGADHMEQVLWQTAQITQAKPAVSLKQRAKTWIKAQIKGSSLSSVVQVDRLLATGKRVILNLGRWEASCYKNSESCIELARSLKADYPEAVIVALADPEKLDIPAEVRGNLMAIGFPDDAELQAIMQRVSLGVSVSLWEGFNLPLAEMQWLEKPALVYDLGAHPEVVVHPWFLCADQDEMLRKIRLTFAGQIPAEVCDPVRYEQWRSFFNWQRVVDEYETKLQQLLLQSPALTQRRMGSKIPLLIVDVTNSCRDPANSGVVRVTRQLSRMLQQRIDPVFVQWDFDSKQYVMPGGIGYHCLRQFNGPDLPILSRGYIDAGHAPPSLDEFLMSHGEFSSRPKVFLFAETILDPRCSAALAYVKARRWESVAILYDLIPMLYPEYCGESVKECFVPYLAMLAGVDQTIGISEYSAQCFRDYCDKNQLLPGLVNAVMLPGEFGPQHRDRRPAIADDCLKLLCVSTLEPRKNHRSLLKACEILTTNYPDVAWELTLVGNRYEEAPEIYQAVEALAAKDDRIQWLGVVDDTILHQCYGNASVTVYSSLVEGFGMPILESVWHGRPCLCHHQGVMAELAAQTPGCLTVDMTNPEAIAEQLAQLARRRDVLQDLTNKACYSPLKTWNTYVDQVFDLLNLQDIKPMNSLDSKPWQDVLYPNCPMPNWQMHDSERMALAGLLARQQPSCAVEIGTYHGGSLSLIAQYAEMAFSIDIDPEVRSRFFKPDNVSLLIGPSTEVLPPLMERLEQEDIVVDFILIDGDHSSEGVRRDINLVLSYVPKKTTFVVMHDSFNPGCRQGMLDADWEGCPYVSWVDIDFVPGRVIETAVDNPFGGEMWGGLALAILSPEPRTEPLQIAKSAQTSFNIAVQTRP